MTTEITVAKNELFFFEKAVDSLIGLSLLAKEWKDDEVVLRIGYCVVNSLVRLGQMVELEKRMFELEKELKGII